MAGRIISVEFYALSVASKALFSDKPPITHGLYDPRRGPADSCQTPRTNTPLSSPVFRKDIQKWLDRR